MGIIGTIAIVLVVLFIWDWIRWELVWKPALERYARRMTNLYNRTTREDDVEIDLITGR